LDRLFCLPQAVAAIRPGRGGSELREGHLDEAVLLAERYKRSHLATVLVAGLQEFRAHGSENVRRNLRQADRSQ